MGIGAEGAELDSLLGSIGQRRGIGRGRVRRQGQIGVQGDGFSIQCVLGDALSDLRLVLSSETFGQQVVEDGGEGVREELVDFEVLFLDQFGELGFDGPLCKFDEWIEIGWSLLALSGQDCRRDASSDLECFGAVLRIFQELFADPAGQFDRDVQAGLWAGVC